MRNHKRSRSIKTMLLECRNPYLEFLRNLTPQIALLTLAMFIGAKAWISPTGIQESILLAIFLVLFSYAVWANATRLYESCFPLWIEWNKRTSSRARRLKLGSIQSFRYIWATMLRLKFEVTAVIVSLIVGPFFWFR
ncbi:hypothetical protein [Massilia scottii]|uniref:hypothetical protein n=1 Tax=Massilia scottii TaxID=3057166 RepID=UPI0027969450|nr:hypothetical protein [Massilia sp. CCM 9029]MDQ1835214.1 hypothetical protein [Massilia sp. CCM 9029]